MSHYRLYFIDAGRFVRAEDFLAPDDAAARVMAGEASGGRSAELWCGGRKVITLAEMPCSLGASRQQIPLRAREILGGIAVAVPDRGT